VKLTEPKVGPADDHLPHLGKITLSREQNKTPKEPVMD
jgi:hypothetical protein